MVSLLVGKYIYRLVVNAKHYSDKADLMNCGEEKVGLSESPPCQDLTLSESAPKISIFLPFVNMWAGVQDSHWHMRYKHVCIFLCSSCAGWYKFPKDYTPWSRHIIFVLTNNHFIMLLIRYQIGVTSHHYSTQPNVIGNNGCTSDKLALWLIVSRDSWRCDPKSGASQRWHQKEVLPYQTMLELCINII